jgi:phage shock protein A
MGYRLKMSAEIYEWLAELRDSDPPTAILAAQALTALADSGDRLGPPLVTAVAAVRPRPDELASALDQHYQDQLESLTLMRRQVAEAATLRKEIELQLTEPEPPPHPAGLQERFAAAIEAEERLTAASQREQTLLDAFRTRKEVLKAAYTAAEAVHLIEQAQGAVDNAFLPDDAAESAARLDEIIGQIEQELGLEAPAEGLMELRPGAPADDGIRILFAVEPPGTALLIAVLEGDDAVRDHYRDAVLLASEVLQEARAYRAREEAAHAFGDAQSFLEEFFPGRADELRAGTMTPPSVPGC